MKCIECQAPARAIRGTDLASDHCSDACVNVTWKRYMANAECCVGVLTVEDIDEKLSTTGLSFEAVAS